LASVSLRAGFDEVRGSGVELREPRAETCAPDSAFLSEFVDWWYRRHIAGLEGFRELILRSFEFDGRRFSAPACAGLQQIFEHYSRAQALAATRVFATGSEQ